MRELEKSFESLIKNSLRIICKKYNSKVLPMKNYDNYIRVVRKKLEAEFKVKLLSSSPQRDDKEYKEFFSIKEDKAGNYFYILNDSKTSEKGLEDMRMMLRSTFYDCLNVFYDHEAIEALEAGINPVIDYTSLIERVPDDVSKSKLIITALARMEDIRREKGFITEIEACYYMSFVANLYQKYYKRELLVTEFDYDFEKYLNVYSVDETMDFGIDDDSRFIFTFNARTGFYASNMTKNRDVISSNLAEIIGSSEVASHLGINTDGYNLFKPGDDLTPKEFQMIKISLKKK